MKKIVILEDDRIIRKIIEKRIKEENISIVFFETAETAYDFAKINDDIIGFIVDVGLPGYKTGIEFCKIIRGLEEYRTIPIMVMSIDQENVIKAKKIKTENLFGVVKNGNEHIIAIIDFIQENKRINQK